MRQSVLVCLIGLAALRANPALADEQVVAARGEVTIRGDDIQAARVGAIDTALADAVGQALTTLVGEADRQRHRKLLNKQIVRRARRFVAGFKVLAEESADGRYRVRVSARVNTAGIRERLGELDIDMDARANSATSEPRPAVVALVHASLGERVQVNFGAQGDARGAAIDVVSARLDEQGFQTVSPLGATINPAREVLEGLPLADETAAAVASEVGAGGAFVVGVEASREGPIRATNLIGALARARIRVVDVDTETPAKSRLIAEADVRAAGFGDTEERALADATARAADRALRAITDAAVAHWPPLIASDDALLIEVRGYRSWRDVRALRKRLADTHGIERVWPHQLGRRGVILAVRTDIDRRRVAAAVRRTVLDQARVKVRVRGQRGLQVAIVPIVRSDAEGAANGREVSP